MSFSVIDLDKIVTEFFKKRVPSSAKKYCNVHEPRIDWDSVSITYGDPVFTRHGGPRTPTANILFRSKFSNRTPEPQTFTLNSVRVTTSSCELSIMNTFSVGGNIGMNASIPVNGTGVRAKFNFDRTTQKGNINTSEQELTWAINSDIVVPSKCTTTAELKIKEEDLSGDFEMDTTFDGKVYVDYKHEKEGDIMHSDSEDVALIFKDITGFFRDEHGSPLYTVKGNCKCRIGVEQMITLKEGPLSEFPVPFRLQGKLVIDSK